MFDRKAYAKEYNKKYRESNKNKIKQYRIQYKKENKEKSKEYQRKYYKNNPEKYRRYFVKYYNKNKTIIKERIAKWNAKNKDKINVYHKKGYEKNKIKCFARTYAGRHQQRRPHCLLHLLEDKEIPAINFHHTDYEANLGFSVCQEHHTIVDLWLKNEYKRGRCI